MSNEDFLELFHDPEVEKMANMMFQQGLSHDQMKEQFKDDQDSLDLLERFESVVNSHMEF